MAGRDARFLGKDYKFGDTDIAAARLSTVAEAFATSSMDFLTRSVAGPVRLAVDLGCGPGYTTRLLAEATSAQRVVGLDTSPSFLSLADWARTERVSFREHDVAVMPLPVEGPDLLYGRLLLTHLRDPVSAIRGWARQLVDGGRLLLDEVDSVWTEHPAAQDYQRVVTSMLRSYGQCLEIGPVLASFPDPRGLSRLDERLVEVRPTSRQVGLMFSLNLRVLSRDPFVQDTFDGEWIRGLLEKLEAVAAGETHMTVTWTMRQLLFSR